MEQVNVLKLGKTVRCDTFPLAQFYDIASLGLPLLLSFTWYSQNENGHIIHIIFMEKSSALAVRICSVLVIYRVQVNTVESQRAETKSLI